MCMFLNLIIHAIMSIFFFNYVLDWLVLVVKESMCLLKILNSNPITKHYVEIMQSEYK